jgi:hypothetical protein
MKFLCITANNVCLPLGKKAPGHFFWSFFVFFFFSQQAKKSSIKIKLWTSWTPSQWKASLHHDALKKLVPFLPVSCLQSCLCESAYWTGEHQAVWETSLLRLSLYHSKTGKYKQWTVILSWQLRLGWNTESALENESGARSWTLSTKLSLKWGKSCKG